jgi:hypothetical protein
VQRELPAAKAQIVAAHRAGGVEQGRDLRPGKARFRQRAYGGVDQPLLRVLDKVGAGIRRLVHDAALARRRA